MTDAAPASQPPPRDRIRLGNWRTHPASLWSFQNVGELVPAADILRGEGETEPGPGAGALDAMALVAPDGERTSAVAHLENSHGDAFVALRDGQIVAEWYAPHCDPARPHIIFSISKSVTGLLAGIAVADGMLDPEAPVTDHVAVQPGSAFADARVRDLLDMTVAIDFEEDYLDRESDFDRYRRAMLWNPEHDGSAPETLHEVLASLARAPGAHGERFRYASPVTDMLGMVVEKATGFRYHDYLARRLFGPMGARGPSCVTVDRKGTARAAGGISMTARDLARLGQLVLDGGAAGGRQIVPVDWIADIRTNGKRSAWVDGDFAGLFPDGRYRSCWYAVGDDNGSLSCIGIHEQWLWIDPVNKVVLAKMSSRPEPSHDPATMREASMLAQIARELGRAA